MPIYTTLEENYAIMDGSSVPFPEEPELYDMGYWSLSMSDENGNFHDPPWIMPVFEERSHTSPGLTLHFHESSNDYASEIKVTWYNQSDSILSQELFQVDSPKFFVEHQVNDYAKIKIEFLSTNKPFRYVKLLNVDYGFERIFGRDDIKNASLLEEVDFLSTELTTNEFKFTIFSEEDDFSPLNPVGFFSLLQEGQKIRAYEIIDNEEVFLGGFYIDSWSDIKENSITFRTVDSVGKLDEEYIGGVYDGILSGELIADIMQTANVSYSVDSSYKFIPVSGYIPICTCREALLQVAITINAIVTSCRMDEISIIKPPKLNASYITNDRKYMDEKIDFDQLVSGVTVLSHRYVLGDIEEEIISDEFESGAHEINFTDPVNNLKISGATIISFNPNRCVIDVGTKGEVNIFGKQYFDMQRVRRYNSTTRPTNSKSTAYSIEKATLMDEDSAAGLAERIYSYYKKRFVYTVPIITKNEVPGNYVIIDSIREEKLKGVIESMKFENLENSFKSTIKVRCERINTVRGQHMGNGLYAGQGIGVM